MRACDYKVFGITYDATQSERVYDQSGESEVTGRKVTERRKYLCVAPTGPLAIAAFVRYHPAPDNVIIEMEASEALGDILIVD